MTTAMLTSNWLHGDKFSAWLRDHGLTSPALQVDFNAARLICKWESQGGLASVYTADRILTRLGFHLSELPDDIWADRSPTDSRVPAETREQAVARLAAGERAGAIAAELGVDRRTVSYWARSA